MSERTDLNARVWATVCNSMNLNVTGLVQSLHAKISSVSDAATKLATYRDFEALPRAVRAELIARGRNPHSPAALPKHSKAQRALGRFIGGPFDDDHGFGGPGRYATA